MEAVWVWLDIAVQNPFITPNLNAIRVSSLPRYYYENVIITSPYGFYSTDVILNPSSINFLRSSKCVWNFHSEPHFGLYKRKWPGQITVRNVPQRSRGTLMAWQWYARICSTAMFHGCWQCKHKVKCDVSSRVDASNVPRGTNDKQTFDSNKCFKQAHVSNDRLNYAWRK